MGCLGMTHSAETEELPTAGSEAVQPFDHHQIRAVLNILETRSTATDCSRQSGEAKSSHCGERLTYRLDGNRVAAEGLLRELEERGWRRATEVDTRLPQCAVITVSDSEPTISDRRTSLPRDIILVAAPAAKLTPIIGELETAGYRSVIQRGPFSYFSRGLPVAPPEWSLTLGEVRADPVFKSNLRRVRDLPEGTRAAIEVRDPACLLNPARFDIAIKAVYGRLFLQRRARDWAEKCYTEQAVRITGPSRTIAEKDGTGKQGLDQFLSGFHSLLEATVPTDIPPVPADRHLVAYDGAHRIATALSTHRTVDVLRIDASRAARTDWQFFQRADAGHPPCDPEVMGAAAVEYCRLKDRLALALIFPSVGNHRHALDSLETAGQVVYAKELRLTPAAGRTLLRQAYLGHHLIDPERSSRGFEDKVSSCFPHAGRMTAVLLDGIDFDRLRARKEEIRKHYGVGNHSIHITDSDDETLRLARAVFHQSSASMLELIDRSDRAYNNKLIEFRNWMESSRIDPDDVCVEGGGLLELLGLRETRDMDFIYEGDREPTEDSPSGFDVHNDYAHFHRHSMADILGDPRLHFWYQGVKFCTPDVLIDFKKNRGETKDARDIALLRTVWPVRRNLLSRISQTLSAQYLWLLARSKRKAKRVVKRILRVR